MLNVVLCQWCGEWFAGERGTLTCSPVCSLEYFDHLKQLAAKRLVSDYRKAEERAAGGEIVNPERS